MEPMALARTDALTISPAALLYLKVAAFVLMVADHADWLLGSGQGAHASVGRLVFPIFALVLGYNMARTTPEKLLSTVAPRLCVIGLVAQLPYTWLQGGVLPLNIMFTLAAGVVVYAGLQRRQGGLLIGLIAGFFVDYAWPGIFGLVAIAVACQRRIEWQVMAAMLAMAAGLYLVNGNPLAMLAVPLVWIVCKCAHGDAPRLKWLFWAGYPVHLVVLLVIKLAS